MEISDLDTIGHWSQLKLEILGKYAIPYSSIMEKAGLRHYYIDAFSGPGIHVKKGTDELLSGSPLRALTVVPPFSGYHLIDTDERKTQMLQSLVDRHFSDKNVTVYGGDCNQILPKVLSGIKYENKERALCFFDPYSLHLDWKVIEMAGKSKVVDMFLNFPILGMNRNVLRHNPETVAESQILEMTKFWGDASWREVAYKESRDLFGNPYSEKSTNEEMILGFQQRLKDVAGFKYVVPAMPMGDRGRVFYYLMFAAHHSLADKIACSVMSKSSIARSMIKVTGR